MANLSPDDEARLAKALRTMGQSELEVHAELTRQRDVAAIEAGVTFRPGSVDYATWRAYQNSHLLVFSAAKTLDELRVTRRLLIAVVVLMVVHLFV